MPEIPNILDQNLSNVRGTGKAGQVVERSARSGGQIYVLGGSHATLDIYCATLPVQVRRASG